VLEVRQIDAAGALATLTPRLGSPQTLIQESFGKIAQADLRPIFRGEPGKSIDTAPRADATSDPHHDEGIHGEAIAVVHVRNVRSVLMR
jgi:hypothetical protein